MARQFISLEATAKGPLFDGDSYERFKDALAGGIQELAEQGGDLVANFVRAGGFIDTGRFVGSTVVEITRTRGAGWAKVYQEDQWPAPGRPTRTWMETGRRHGVRLRKGTYAYRKTARRLNKAKYEQVFLPKIVEAIG